MLLFMMQEKGHVCLQSVTRMMCPRRRYEEGAGGGLRSHTNVMLVGKKKLYRGGVGLQH